MIEKVMMVQMDKDVENEYECCDTHAATLPVRVSLRIPDLSQNTNSFV
jgi:hypothetical protein